MLFYCVLFIKILIIILPLLIAVAYFTLVERKILGAIQRRRGPNVIGTFGLFQPLADGLKLFVKEFIIPSDSNKFIFVFSPLITFFISLIGWSVIPFNAYSVLADVNLGVIYILVVSSLGVFGIILSGWSSNSKYPFLGSLRSTSQMISYEISIGFIVLTIILVSGTVNISNIILAQKNIWYVIPFLPLAIFFFICGLAETNRHPFDLPEAEAELVSGYNVEYSSMFFAYFSLGEYSNMLLMSSLNVIFFFGGWLPFPLLFKFLSVDLFSFWFGLKVCFFVLLFIWMRAVLPRYRYDQLMNLGWKIFLPVAIFYCLITYLLLYSFNFLPL